MNKKNNQKIQIKPKYEGGSIFTELYIDGHKIRGVRSVKFEQRAGNALPVLTIELNALNTSIDQEALIFMEGFGEVKISFKDNEVSEEPPTA